MSNTIRPKRRRTSSNFNEGASAIDLTFSNDPPRVRRRRTASDDPSKSLPEKVRSSISNVLSRKTYLNKEWKRIKTGTYQPIVKKRN